MSCIIAIASFDFPEIWSDLFDNILSLLSHDTAAVVAAALDVLEGLADLLGCEDIVRVWSALNPVLHKLVTSTATPFVGTAGNNIIGRHALRVVTAIVGVLYSESMHTDPNLKNISKAALAEFNASLPSWFHVVIKVCNNLLLIHTTDHQQFR